MELGPSATSLTFRSLQDDLVLCQRYYEKSYDLGTLAGTATNTGGQNCVVASVNDLGATTYYKVTKRTAPTITPYSPATGTSNAVRNYSSAADVTGVSTEVSDAGFRVYKTASFTAGQFCAYQWTASAEL